MAEAGETALSAFRFIFQSEYRDPPELVTVIAVNNTYAEFFRVTVNFPLADQVFFLRIDIRVIEEDRRFDPVIEHPLENRSRAGRAARMQKDF